MLSAWGVVALYALLPLAIVPLILIGRLLPNGAITATSGAAVIALSIFFTFLNGGYGLSTGPGQETPGATLVWLLALILLFAAWALALADATQGRRWRWLFPLTATAYLSFGALLALAILPDPCLFQSGQTLAPGSLQCSAPDQTLHLLTLVGCYMGALTALLYSLRDTLPRRESRPASVAVSSLRARESAGEDSESVTPPAPRP